MIGSLADGVQQLLAGLGGADLVEITLLSLGV